MEVNLWESDGGLPFSTPPLGEAGIKGIRPFAVLSVNPAEERGIRSEPSVYPLTQKSRAEFGQILEWGLKFRVRLPAAAWGALRMSYNLEEQERKGGEGPSISQDE